MTWLHMPNVDLENILGWANSEPDIKRVWLYGSRARGDHREDSDVDLAVEFDEDDPDQASAMWIAWFSEFKKRPRLLLRDVKLHLQFYHPSADLDIVGPAVRKDGILLHEKR